MATMHCCHRLFTKLTQTSHIMLVVEEEILTVLKPNAIASIFNITRMPVFFSDTVYTTKHRYICLNTYYITKNNNKYA